MTDARRDDASWRRTTDNIGAIADMRDRIDAITHPLAAETESEVPCSQVDYDLPEPH